MTDNRERIEQFTQILRKLPTSREKEILQCCEFLYTLLYTEIHKVLAPEKTDESEEQIRAYIRDIIKLELPISQRQYQKFDALLPKYKKLGVKENIDKCYEYRDRWAKLYDNFYALVAFRSLRHYCEYLEGNKRDKDKVWKYSIDPQGDGGFTGVNFPFFYYFNQMVLKKDIKFISKQQATGTGKCLIPTTKIMTPSGTKMLKDINVGDYVYSMKDNELCERQVLGKWNTKKKQITITTRGGVNVTVSPEHRLYTQRGYIQAQDIKQSDYLYRLCSKHEPKNPVMINDDELVFVACMLFDGHCKSQNYTFTKMPNTKIVKAFRTACNNLGINLTTHSKQGTDCLTYRVWQNGGIANEIMQRYGLEGKLSKEKRLPKQFFNMSLAQKYKFIGLMFATDGYITKYNNSGITTASKELALELRNFLDTCGIYSYLNFKKSKCNGKLYDAWVLTVADEYLKPIFENCYCYDKQIELMEKFARIKDSAYCNNTNYPKELFKNKNEFKNRVHRQWYRNKTFKRCIVEDFNRQTNTLNDIVYKDFVWEQIKSIEFNDNEVDMIDIEVEDTHNFIANHIVSHNSYSNTMAITWLLGIDSDNDCLVVLGNPALVLTNTKGIVDTMITDRYAKVFPEFQQYHDIDDDGIVRNKIFSVCRQKEGELTIAHSNKAMNVKIISKDTPVDGIRVRYLFLDDVCRSKDAGNNKQHEIDISNYWNSWWKRNYNTDDFYVIVGGTAYSIYDILSSLKIYYSKGKVKRSPVNKYTTLSLDDKCVFIAVPALDPDTDESTYPQKFPTAEKRAMRDRNLRDFMAMEQQQPLPPETSPFYWDNLQTYDVIPEEGRSNGCWATIDPVRVGGDNFAMPIFVKVGDYFYLKDCIYMNIEQDKIYPVVVGKIRQHHITQLVIERNTDTSLKKVLEDMCSAQGIGFCNMEEIYTYEKKEIRITNQQSNIKTQLRFPAQHLYSQASEMGRFMYDIVSFSWDMSKNQHDDSIDAVTMFCETLLGGKMQQYATVGTFKR